MPVRLILVGGFLGAGKTTLLAQAAVRLAERGLRVGLVANDQAADLVDTELMKRSGAQVEEVAGGCFCCRFGDMVEAMQRLVDQAHADVLIGEPVGSCTDLSATVMQPLKDLHRAAFEVAPFSVLVDGRQVRVLARLRADMEGAAPSRFPDNVLYIYEKQLEEADAIVLNKTDLLTPAERSELVSSLSARFAGTPIIPISALTGEGIDVWLDFVTQQRPAGRKIVEVDYDTYAAGEAALGWMNASVSLAARQSVEWNDFATRLLEAIRTRLRDQSAEIAHLKIFLTAAGGHLVGNITSNDGPASVRGALDETRQDVALLVNARVHTSPEALRAAVEAAVAEACGARITATFENVRSFFPGRPVPQHRYDHPIP